MHEVKAKPILSTRNGANLCQGCSHGCTYYDSRSTCYGVNRAFEDTEIKIGSSELLEQALRRRGKRYIISTGAICDSYMPAERSLGLTRKCLGTIEHYGSGVLILTRSDPILRDLDLLKRINQKTRCVVQITLTTRTENQCRIVEPHVCTISHKAQMLEIMRDGGVPAIIWTCSILPFINDTEENIQGIIECGEKARVHGTSTFDTGVTLRDGNRRCFYSRLDEHYPGLKRQHMGTYRNACKVGSLREKELMAFFKRLCRERQMETDINKLFAYLQKLKDKGTGEQLNLTGLVQSLLVILGVPVKPGSPVSFPSIGNFLLRKPPFHSYP